MTASGPGCVKTQKYRPAPLEVTSTGILEANWRHVRNFCLTGPLILGGADVARKQRQVACQVYSEGQIQALCLYGLD